jgi:phosphatidylglycerophosphate synthase
MIMQVPHISKADVLSPANAISLVGLGLTIYGSFNITSLTGVLLLGAGRFIDVFDGPIARRTHTSSFGALVDATCDKIGIAFLVGAVWIADYVPTWLLVYVVAQNIANVMLSWLTARRGMKPTASKSGKYAMFLQNVSIGLYALGAVLEQAWLDLPGLIVAVVSMYFAARATSGYFNAVPKKR